MQKRHACLPAVLGLLIISLPASFSAMPSCKCTARAPPPMKTAASRASTMMGNSILPGGEATFSETTAQTVKPSTLWGAFRAPLPTNQWWTNLVTGKGDQPISPLPYMVRAGAQGVDVGYPKPVVTDTDVINGFTADVSLGFSEAAKPRYLSHFDPLVTAMRWRGAAGGTFDATFARGSPYQTVVYGGLTPTVAIVHAITSINGAPAAVGRAVAGKRFALGLNNGQTWVVYTSKPVSLTLEGTQNLTASTPFSGVLRVALVPAAGAAVLDANASIWPAEGSVTNQMTAKDTATVTFEYTVRTMAGGAVPAGAKLLNCLLPHHIDAKASAPAVLQGAYNSIKGPMTCVAASAVLGANVLGFTITEPLTQISWGAPRAVAADRKAAVAAALAADAGTTPVAPDPYFFGKEVAAMGRRALIADELGEAATAAAIRGRMKAALAPWLAGTNGDPLRYDSNWGGICSAAGLADGGADFGNGLYNDHLFHYGYFAYAAAALGRKDAAWLAANQDPLDDLLRDFANPRTTDSQFPFARQKDWFDGHSWASGVTPFAAGKNQESSSEAVNGYYGVYLLGLARGDADLANWGRLLLATELRSAKKYWHIKPTGPQIYPPAFAKNGVVGVLWSAQVSYATWFGANVEFIHGIQMLPFTPISEQLLTPDWVVTEYPIVAKALPTAAPSWQGFIYMQHAVINKTAAWAELQTLSSWDDGNSKTNALWWAATRP